MHIFYRHTNYMTARSLSSGSSSTIPSCRISCGTARTRNGKVSNSTNGTSYCQDKLLTTVIISYLIDFEDTEYDPNYHDPEVFTKGEYFHWNLARSWAEPNW